MESDLQPPGLGAAETRPTLRSTARPKRESFMALMGLGMIDENMDDLKI